MIKEIQIRNYKCFQQLNIKECRRINVLVGDNGAGKTALLEAIFLTLAGNAQVAMRQRATRGLDAGFSGTPRMIEDALWGGLFHKFSTHEPISIKLTGSGRESRSLNISRAKPTTVVPLQNTEQQRATGSYRFVWRDARKREYDGTPTFLGSNLSFPPELEDLPDYFYFSSVTVGGATENANRFSELSKAHNEGEFVRLFTKEYPWITNLSIETVAGLPVIHATLNDMPDKIPLNSISSGINRLLSILLVMPQHPNGVVIVDEIENGLYYKHQASFWRWLLSFSKTSNCQLILSTHSAEWLDALAEAGEYAEDDIALWRIERDRGGKPVLREMKGKQGLLAIKAGGIR
jgi:AAA15 family ATPase/GTPase